MSDDEPGIVTAASGPFGEQLFCTGCGYALVGLSMSSDCPECGVAVEASKTSAFHARGQAGRVASSMAGAVALSAMMLVLSVVLTVPALVEPMPCLCSVAAFLLMHVGAIVTAAVAARRLPPAIHVGPWRRMSTVTGILVGLGIPVIVVVALLSAGRIVASDDVAMIGWVWCALHALCLGSVARLLGRLAPAIGFASSGRWFARLGLLEFGVAAIALVPPAVVLGAAIGGGRARLEALALTCLGAAGIGHFILLIAIGVVAQILHRDIAERRGSVGIDEQARTTPAATERAVADG
jgi:hypothetical protein